MRNIFMIFQKLSGTANNHAHFQGTTDGFAVHHYAGVVSYSVEGFCDKNRDVLFLDLIELMQTSTKLVDLKKSLRRLKR